MSRARYFQILWKRNKWVLNKNDNSRRFIFNCNFKQSCQFETFDWLTRIKQQRFYPFSYENSPHERNRNNGFSIFEKKLLQQSSVLIIHIISSQVNTCSGNRVGGILYLSIAHTVMCEATFEREILKWYCCRNNTISGSDTTDADNHDHLRSSYLFMTNERERESVLQDILEHLI